MRRTNKIIDTILNRDIKWNFLFESEKKLREHNNVVAPTKYLSSMIFILSLKYIFKEFAHMHNADRK